MSKGPQKPTPLKVLEGNRSKIKDLGKNEPKPMPKAPKCPSDIDKNAKKVWMKLAPILERLGLLTEVDQGGFANICQIRSRLIAIHEFLKTENASLIQLIEKPAPDGGVNYEMKASPYTIMERQYYQLYRMYAAEFGLTPRGRVGLVVGTDKDDGDDLLT